MPCVNEIGRSWRPSTVGILTPKALNCSGGNALEGEASRERAPQRAAQIEHGHER